MLIEAVALLVLLGFKAAREERWLGGAWYPSTATISGGSGSWIPFVY
ncbi:MAG: hypothetical protein R2882_14805 [Gemmatimonadales bacterium]